MVVAEAKCRSIVAYGQDFPVFLLVPFCVAVSDIDTSDTSSWFDKFTGPMAVAKFSRAASRCSRYSGKIDSTVPLFLLRAESNMMQEATT